MLGMMYPLTLSLAIQLLPILLKHFSLPANATAEPMNLWIYAAVDLVIPS